MNGWLQLENGRLSLFKQRHDANSWSRSDGDKLLVKHVLVALMEEPTSTANELEAVELDELGGDARTEQPAGATRDLPEAVVERSTKV